MREPERAQLRAARARRALARAQGNVQREPPAAAHTATSWREKLRQNKLIPLEGRIWRHAALALLVLLLLLGEQRQRWSRLITASLVSPTATLALTQPFAEGAMIASVPRSLGPMVLSRPAQAVVPAFSQPAEVSSALQVVHQLEQGETLGALAARYGVSVETLVWANGLERGDALIAGQLLNIPHVSGVTHTIREGETLALLAQRYSVSELAIASFPSNQQGAQRQLLPGGTIFVPGAQPALAEEMLRAVGGMDGLAKRGPEAAGIVQAAETNLRTGPSTAHPRLTQLDAGRQVALRGKYRDWLLVEIGPVRGWMRSDMLAVPAEQLAALPETTDFPAAPPRWVWPARATITSVYGARWGGFHNGLDMANRAWTPIVAARSGLVKEAGWCSGYGYCVKLQHDGGMETLYGHMADQPVVQRGDEVSAGELIGHMGSTYDRAGGGYSTGVHLHFTVLLNGKAVDPMRFLP